MGKILECGGSKTFQNLEQCHEIQGEFTKKPLYYTKAPSYIEGSTSNNNQNYINKVNLFDKESELNLIIYNNDEFGYDNMNYSNLNSNNRKISNNNVVQRKVNKSWEYKKKEKNKSFGNINNSTSNRDKNENILNNLIEKEIKNIQLKKKSGIRLIYNNSENNIKNKTNKNRIIKKIINDSKQNKKNEGYNKIINKLFINKKYKQLNYVQSNNNIQDKINVPHLSKNKESMNTTETNEINKEKKQNNSIKRNKSHQIMPSQPNSENNINSKFRKSLKEKKGNYIFRPKIKKKAHLNIGNEPKRKTYLIIGHTSPKLTNEKFFKRNDNELMDYYKKYPNNNTHTNKFNSIKFLPKNNSENCINDLINSQKKEGVDTVQQKNIFDFNINLHSNRRHHSYNTTNNIFKLNNDGKDLSLENNKDIIKIKIQFKGTQINHNLLNSSVNDTFILNYNMLSKFSDNIILYDGNIYKVVNSKKDESKFLLRYFQITKKNFRYYNSIHSLLMTNEKPLEEFNIKYIRDIEIIDIKLLIKKKNEQKIKFAFVINMIENINFYIFATTDEEIGKNIIKILNLIKKYYDKEKD